MSNTGDDAGSSGRKSEAAFRTISEVATDLDVPQHVLRFWETKFTHVKPLKRGGGRRYYRPEDLALLRRIRDLLYKDGLTIKGVQKILRENGVRAVVEGGAGPLSPPASEPAVKSAPPAPANSAPPAFDRDALIAELKDMRDTLQTALAIR